MQRQLEELSETLQFPSLGDTEVLLANPSLVGSLVSDECHSKPGTSPCRREDFFDLRKEDSVKNYSRKHFEDHAGNKQDRIIPKEVCSLPSALDSLNEILTEKLWSRNVILFLDYDGTLAPIVDDPDRAFLPEETKTALLKLTELGIPVAIVSGRARRKIQNFVNIDTLYYAGSHGFDICGPNGYIVPHQVAGDTLPVLGEAAEIIKEQIVQKYPGASMEDNILSKTLHYRRCSPNIIPELEKKLDNILDCFPQLQKTYGKCVFEIRPKFDWDKGKAVEWLLSALAVNSPDVVPIYIGDDRTDEDAFQVVVKKGVAIIVADESEYATFANFRLKDPSEVRKFLFQFWISKVQTVASKMSCGKSLSNCQSC
ncbi:Probable trehalose-phosphate phosphatase E [Galdieria sulphuraria]|nr:Probable trehalose-phosphate phosphatase E [Galdieria sulphuraria]